MTGFALGHQANVFKADTIKTNAPTDNDRLTATLKELQSIAVCLIMCSLSDRFSGRNEWLVWGMFRQNV